MLTGHPAELSWAELTVCRWNTYYPALWTGCTEQHPYSLLSFILFYIETQSRIDTKTRRQHASIHIPEHVKFILGASFASRVLWRTDIYVVQVFNLVSWKQIEFDIDDDRCGWQADIKKSTVTPRCFHKLFWVICHVYLTE